MSLIKLKSTVKVPKNLIIACATINSANKLGLPDMLVTSGNDSKHITGSKHYIDQALDFRTKHLTKSQKYNLVKEVKSRLGSGYDVFLEFEGGLQEHMHVEYEG
mgnify:CR=1 FL=1